MKEYKAYLFDADGTLIDTRELIYRSFVYMTGVLGVVPPDRKTLNSTIGLPIRTQLKDFLGEGKSEKDLDDAHAVYNEFHLREYPNFLKSFPGIAEGLTKLRDMGKMLAVVSSRGSKTLVPFLEAVGIAHFFPVVVTSDDTVRHKPNPDPALLCLERLGAEARDAVLVGDAEFDMACGKAAGMDVAYVAWGGMNYDNWPVKPDFAAQTFQDLLPS